MADLDLLARDLGASGRTLRRAAGRGAIHIQRPSPNKAVVAVAERQYLHSHWSLLALLTQVLRTEKNVRLAVLYGSAARGDDRPGSDVDVLVDLADYDRRLPLARLALRLEEELCRPVQVVGLRDAELTPALLAEVLADGRVLVDRDACWHRLKARERRIVKAARAHEARAGDEAWIALEELAQG